MRVLNIIFYSLWILLGCYFFSSHVIDFIFNEMRLFDLCMAIVWGGVIVMDFVLLVETLTED